MKILIVEDEEKLARAIKVGLNKFGYASDMLFDGEIAQRRIEVSHKDYDLILLDLMLPKKDGYEVCRTIREYNITTPVLVLTARDDLESKILALDSGADDYLVKPFTFEELTARIRALLRRPDNYLPAEIIVGDVKLDSNTMKVQRAGHEIPLTLKEFSLLEYLMRHSNQVMTREQILDHLWGYDFDSFSNVVDVHVKNLRKKLSKTKNDKILETIRGVGYRIKE